MNVNCIVTMGLVPEIKYLVSCILYLVYTIQFISDESGAELVLYLYE